MTQVHQTTSDICLDAEYVRCLLRFRNTEAIFSIDARFWYSLTLSLVKPDSRYSVALKKTSNSISVPKLGPCSLFTVLHGSQWLKLGEIMRRCRQVHTRYYTTGLDWQCFWLTLFLINYFFWRIQFEYRKSKANMLISWIRILPPTSASIYVSVVKPICVSRGRESWAEILCNYVICYVPRRSCRRPRTSRKRVTLYAARPGAPSTICVARSTIQVELELRSMVLFLMPVAILP